MACFALIEFRVAEPVCVCLSVCSVQMLVKGSHSQSEAVEKLGVKVRVRLTARLLVVLAHEHEGLHGDEPHADRLCQLPQLGPILVPEGSRGGSAGDGDGG